MGTMGEFQSEQAVQPSPWLCLQRWYQTPLGQALLAREKAALDETLPGLFGINLVQLGGINADRLYVESKTQRQFVVESLAVTEPRQQQTAMLTEFDQLAIASDSVDVVILPHTLEFEREPHQVLREVERILVPEGHVVYLGFNPISLLGVRHAVMQRRGKKRSLDGAAGNCGRMLSAGRVMDWFKLLGLEVESVERYFYQPPINHHYFLNSYSLSEKLGPKLWPYFAGGYLILAEKRVSTLTPIKPKWRLTKDLLVGKNGIEPTAGYKPSHFSTVRRANVIHRPKVAAKANN